MRAIDVIRTFDKSTTVVIRVRMNDLTFQTSKSAESFANNYLRDDENDEVKKLLGDEIKTMFVNDDAVFICLKAQIQVGEVK